MLKPYWFLSTAALLGIASATAVGLIWASQNQSERIARAMTGGDPSRAPAFIRRYGCAGCHTIPGVPGADGKVGGALSGIKHRVYIGGVATNSAENLTRWIMAPQTFSPDSAMPATGISESEARDVAAFLYSH